MIGNRALSDVFDGVWSREASRIAIQESGRSLTYRDLLRWSEEISRTLAPAVHEPGQRVGLMLANSAAFVAAFFAIARLGGVVAPLAAHATSREIAYHLRAVDAAALVTGPAVVQKALEIVSTLESAPALLDVSEPAEVRVVLRGHPGSRRVPTGVSAALLQLHTSGSTGVPKAVVRTHSALLAELDALRDTFQVAESDRFLGVAPFSHVNGLVRTMLTSMSVGGTLYPMAEFRRRELVDLVTRARVTFVGGVPRMFVVLGQTPLRGAVDFSSVRVLFSASAPLLPVDNRRFQSRYGVYVRQLYGSTETGTISFNRASALESSLDSVGAPLEGVHVEVVDDQGRPLPQGEEGEFAIRSPFATAGYLDNPAATSESFRGGFYLSGDIGRKDRGGALTITGRKSILINCGGFKVNPYEVEQAIREHPKVLEVAVFGSPSGHGDDVVSCVIVPAGPCSAEEIRFHCRDRLGEFKVPYHIEFRDALPLSPSGKILRARLAGDVERAE